MNPEKIDSSRLNAELIARHAVLSDLIGERPFHYVDLPMHGNIGDLLIMQGTLAFFKKYKLRPRSISSMYEFDTEQIAAGEVVVFQGGGNFGDLYAYPHTLREQVAAARPGNRIIILPQSIHFSSADRAAESAALFRGHPDLHLCVRDRVSFEQAKAFTDKVYLLPDMAHQLYPIQGASRRPGRGAMVVARLDEEKAEHGMFSNVQVRTHIDWPQFVGKRERRINSFRRVVRVMARLGMGRLAGRLMSPLWIRYANGLVEEVIRLFAMHELIITDRLHAHILAVLMDMPTHVLDNSYGKNSRYAAMWTARCRLVTMLAPPTRLPGPASLGQEEVQELI